MTTAPQPTHWYRAHSVVDRREAKLAGLDVELDRAPGGGRDERDLLDERG